MENESNLINNFDMIEDNTFMPEYANDKAFHNKKKQIKKELKAMKEKYKNEM